MKPVNAHLSIKSVRSPVEHLMRTVVNVNYTKAFVTNALIATGGFMLMPFASAFAVNNNGILPEELPLLYISSGMVAMIIAPFIGKLSDRVGKYVVFCIFSALMIVSISIYCNLEITPLWLIILFSIVIFTSYAGRMISSSALLSGVPEPLDRGAFMSINSSVNMFSGGIASLIAGTIVSQTASGYLENYNLLGYLVSGTTIITMGMMYLVNKIKHV
jgi:predicted MFS family arabinose efflux permease